jgi:hypothetical protein
MHYSQTVGEQYLPPQAVEEGATCRLWEVAATGCGGRCHMSLGELAAGGPFYQFYLEIILFNNSRWFFLPKIRLPPGVFFYLCV